MINKSMNMINYDVISCGTKILVFLHLEEYPTRDGRLSYKALNNIIYKLNEGYCVTDRKGTPLIIRDTLSLCADFLNAEYAKNYKKYQPIELEADDE